MKIFLKNKKFQTKISLRNVIASSPFDLYAGWISVALIANTAVWLTKINWEPILFSEAGWTIFLLSIAGIIGIFISWNYNAIAFGISIAWGVTAVAVNNFNQNFNIVITAVIVSVAILSVCFYQLMHKILPTD
ncbi:hypothetical protein [Paenimyroides viscosum]|uniref:Uncharacterized protein n=1 Tax=Paenimyroides viscosum TaxID=2488729 RepID=A0A3P1ATF9_9FLAO|nr:hypothetical protein [Paenimyroides viscosum]RRA91990.1 hypothetical protein EG242_12010 [Paenimyroides viscosum]